MSGQKAQIVSAEDQCRAGFLMMGFSLFVPVTHIRVDLTAWHQAGGIQQTYVPAVHPW